MCCGIIFAMDKEYSKRYLISLSALFFGGTAVLSALLFALGKSAFELNFNLTPPVILGTAALCALLPTGSFAGFVLLGSRVKEFNKRKAVLFVIFFPLLLVFVTLYGIVMLVPSVIKTLRSKR